MPPGAPIAIESDGVSRDKKNEKETKKEKDVRQNMIAIHAINFFNFGKQKQFQYEKTHDCKICGYL